MRMYDWSYFQGRFVKLDDQFEVYYMFPGKWMLRVGGSLKGYIEEPTIEACQAKMLEDLL